MSHESHGSSPDAAVTAAPSPESPTVDPSELSGAKGARRFSAPRAESRFPSRLAPPEGSPLDRLLALKPPESKQAAAELIRPSSDPTFFPRRPPARPRRVEPMLEDMADGVLFGEGSDGATEIRVELSDEFLGGAEVRVSIRAGVVSATFVAADLESHRLLLEQSERLAKALLAKGLRVDRVSVERPGSR